MVSIYAARLITQMSDTPQKMLVQPGPWLIEINAIKINKATQMGGFSVFVNV